MDNKIEFWEKVKLTAGAIFTSANMKRLGIGVLVCGVLAGAGSVYWHGQRVNEHRKIIQARTNMLEAQAVKNNIVLLDSDRIQGIAAEAIGVNVSNVEYTQMDLTYRNAQLSSQKDGEGHKKGHRELSKTEPVAPIGTTGYNLATSNLIYNVLCVADNIRYRVGIDAVTGQVVNSKVIGSSHWLNLRQFFM